jgi:hypothetical protein
MADMLFHLSDYCHGFRCDMAMLVLADVFEKTWGPYLAGAYTVHEFWPLATGRAKSGDGPCIFMAEAYWGLEEKLFDLGFDYSYDKGFYDLLAKADIAGLKRHLSAPVHRQQKLIRFLENHDEPRALETFSKHKIRCAMIIQATLPGMRFWQHGQWEGNRIRVPVQLRRAPEEALQEDHWKFTKQLLKEVNHPVFHEGKWEICETAGWPDNTSHQNLLAWCWHKGEERRLVVVNFASKPAQGYVKLPLTLVPEKGEVRIQDPLKGEIYFRSASDLKTEGLYTALNEGDFHFFNFEKG